MQLEVIPQSLKRDLRANLVAVLEAVGHGLGRGVDPYRHAIDRMHLEPFGQSGSGEIHRPHWKGCRARLPGVIAQCEPDFRRCLHREPMEPELTEQAYDSCRNCARDLGQAPMSGNLTVRQCIKAAGDCSLLLYATCV